MIKELGEMNAFWGGQSEIFPEIEDGGKDQRAVGDGSGGQLWERGSSSRLLMTYAGEHLGPLGSLGEEILWEAERLAGTVRWAFGQRDSRALVVSVLRVLIEFTDVSLEELTRKYGAALTADAVLLARPLLGTREYRLRVCDRAVGAGSSTVVLLRLAEFLNEVLAAQTEPEIRLTVSAANRLMVRNGQGAGLVAGALRQFSDLAGVRLDEISGR